MKSLKGAFLLAGVLLGAAAFAADGDFAVSTDFMNYTGTVTRYATLSDAQNQVNAISSGTMQNRDGSLFQGKNAPTAYMGSGDENANVLLTTWWYTTDPDHGAYSGWGNPNNTNDSFIQLYDEPGMFTTSSNAFWSDSFSKLNVTISGMNADYANAYSRLWPAANTGGDSGTFVSYDINYSVGGLAPTVDPMTGWLLDDTSRGSVSGSFTGIFENTSSSVPANNGFYVFNVSLFDSGTTYAEQNAGSLNGALSQAFYAAPVPEPASMAVLGIGALALLRRRNKKG
ncbi:MAG: PEP-CTERM sorting domain-containing protein [Armatimonadetes bacterium]|nr:PEP-CTERM sorting domain-containing protein [Armatimonadota bacterium]